LISAFFCAVFVTSLLGANCRHTYYPFFPGISKPTYTKEQLKNLDPPNIEYNGKKYPYYGVTRRAASTPKMSWKPSAVLAIL
jgi:hypothetical protein